MNNYLSEAEYQQLIDAWKTFNILDYIYQDDEGHQQINWQALKASRGFNPQFIHATPEGKITGIELFNGQSIEYVDGEWIYTTDGIYLIQSESGLTKIGYTNDIKRRLATLQSESPVQLTLLHYWTVPYARVHEYELHERYAKKRVRCEWFNLTSDDIEQIVKVYGRTKESTHRRNTD